MAREKNRTQPPYRGFEQGLIRPPSEAASLLLRVTRNCPWNRCAFCPVYKGARFSLRPMDHVLRDVDAVRRQVDRVLDLAGTAGGMTRRTLEEGAAELGGDERMAFYAAANWVAGGMRSIFLQDADSLVIKPDALVTILRHVRRSFPAVARITSYARSATIDRIGDADLERIAAAGLTRIHIGMESGSDRVLALMEKGADQATHVRAGQKVKRAGLELSEYVMPGLGGRALSREHALETAAALNRIDADFIRLRTLAIPDHTELYAQWQGGSFDKLGDREVTEEILLFLNALAGITSTVQSDHILNLFQEIEGALPQDRERMTAALERFLALAPEEQVLYQVGRRAGLLAGLADLDDPCRRQRAEDLCRRYRVTPETVDTVVDELMKRFI